MPARERRLCKVHTGRRGAVCVKRLRFNTVAPETAEHFDQRFTAYSRQLTQRLHFSVALLALAGIPDLLGHPVMVCAKSVGTMKILSRKTTAQRRPYFTIGKSESWHGIGETT
jgi:hypothetical protein